MRIGILTGGGDVPGLNPAIKTVTYRAESEGHEIVGIRRGWMGLLHYNPDDPETHELFIRPLNKANTRTIDRTGGTFLHTSRTNPSRVRPEQAPVFLKPEEKEPDEDGGSLDFAGGCAFCDGQGCDGLHGLDSDGHAVDGSCEDVCEAEGGEDGACLEAVDCHVAHEERDEGAYVSEGS